MATPERCARCGHVSDYDCGMSDCRCMGPKPKGWPCGRPFESEGKTYVCTQPAHHIPAENHSTWREPAPSSEPEALPPEVEELLADVGDGHEWNVDAETFDGKLAALRAAIASALREARDEPERALRKNNRIHDEQMALGRKQLAAAEAELARFREARGEKKPTSGSLVAEPFRRDEASTTRAATAFDSRAQAFGGVTMSADPALPPTFAYALTPQTLPPLDPAKCSEEVYRDGESMGPFYMERKTADDLVLCLRTVTGWAWDWNFAAGRVVLRWLKPRDPNAGANRGGTADATAPNSQVFMKPDPCPSCASSREARAPLMAALRDVLELWDGEPELLPEDPAALIAQGRRIEGVIARARAALGEEER